VPPLASGSVPVTPPLPVVARFVADIKLPETVPEAIALPEIDGVPPSV
jgi:hypothetical protein